MALIRPKKKLGQNFLSDKNILKKIIKVFSPAANQNILEIGPGTGSLTEYLFEVNPHLIVVEIDFEAISVLEGKFKDLRIINDDFLKLELGQFFNNNEKLRIIGNIPYYITTPIIFKIFDNSVIISDAIIMMQQEVANRLIAKPGSKDYGILSIFSQYFSVPKKLFNVSKNVFYPKPKVDSSVVSFVLRAERELKDETEVLFRKIVRTAFNQRRKTLRNSLEKIISTEIQTNLNFDFSVRAEELSVPDFIFLTNQVLQIKSGNIYQEEVT